MEHPFLPLTKARLRHFGSSLRVFHTIHKDPSHILPPLLFPVCGNHPFLSTRTSMAIVSSLLYKVPNDLMSSSMSSLTSSWAAVEKGASKAHHMNKDSISLHASADIFFQKRGGSRGTLTAAARENERANSQAAHVSTLHTYTQQQKDPRICDGFEGRSIHKAPFTTQGNPLSRYSYTIWNNFMRLGVMLEQRLVRRGNGSILDRRHGIPVSINER